MRIIILSTHAQGEGGVERFSAYLQSAVRQSGSSAVILGQEDISGFARAAYSIASRIGLGQPVLGFFLGRLARKKGFDVCVTNGMLGWNLRGPIVNVQHGTFARAAERIDRKRNFLKFLMKKYGWGFFEGMAARHAVRCVAVSNETKESVEKLYRVPEVMVIANAVDTDVFIPRNQALCRQRLGLPLEKKLFLFAGRFEYAKGKEILDGIRNGLDEAEAALIVAEHYSEADLALLYAASDVFLLPSLHEGCSYALLEAMSSGLPFAASPVGLVSDFAAEGLFSECIVREQTASAYLAAIRRLLTLSADEKAKLTGDIRGYIVKSHGLAAFSDAYLQLFRKILPIPV